MEYDVFISYSRQDAQFAAALLNSLEKYEVRCWRDKEGIGIGNWAEKIVSALDSVPIVVLVYSSNSQNSSNVLKELTLAEKKGRLVIPIRIENIEPSGAFEYHLSTPNFIDVFDNISDTFDTIAQNIKHQVSSLHPSRNRPIDEPHASGSMTATERYLNALRIAHGDGTVTSMERDKLNSLAMDAGISADQMKEYEEQIKRNIVDKSDKHPESVEKIVGIDWPDIGIHFLKAVHSAIDPQQMPFPIQYTSTEKDISGDMEVDWYLNNKHYFAVWLTGKRQDKVNVQWGIYSENTSRDPLFRQMSDALSKTPELLDKTGVVSISNSKYFFEAGDNYLGIETYERKNISDLTDCGYAKYVAEQLIAFANKIWPVAQKNLVKG